MTRQGLRFDEQVRADQLARAGVDEGRTSGDQLVEHAADRVEISTVVDVAGALALLRGHVRRRAHDRAGLGGAAGQADVSQLRDPEVEDLGALAGRRVGIGNHEDVVGFEVAMDDALGVRRGERAAHAPHQQRGLGLRGDAPRLDPVRQGLSLEELHDQERVPRGHETEVEHLHDAGVFDRRGRLRFVEEPVDDLAIARQLGVEDLHRCNPPDQGVLGAIHCAHATDGDAVGDPVTTHGRPEHGRIIPGAVGSVKPNLARHLGLSPTWVRTDV